MPKLTVGASRHTLMKRGLVAFRIAGELIEIAVELIGNEMERKGNGEHTMKNIGTVPLETERLILRRFAESDDKAMFANWVTDPDVTKYLMWPPHASIEATRQTLESIWLSRYGEPGFYQWAIVPKDLNEPIGSIGAVKHDELTKMVHIGYCIGKMWWRKGYMTEALKRLVKFFFEEAGVNRIESRHDPRNPNSGKVMQKAGLLYEGTSRESDWNNQGICDAANYAMLARDYFGRNEAKRNNIPVFLGERAAQSAAER